MILTDSGPLVAIVDKRDTHHARCRTALKLVELPLLTSLAALTEAMYFLGVGIGWHAQQALFRKIADGQIVASELSLLTLLRMEELMAMYEDTPMDFADASLVAIAEERSLKRIFTIDDHFRVYRLHGRERFDIVPNDDRR